MSLTGPEALAAMAQAVLENRRTQAAHGLTVVEEVPAEERERRAEDRKRRWAAAIRLGCGVPKVEAEKAAYGRLPSLRPLGPGERQPRGVTEGHALTGVGIAEWFIQARPQMLLLLGGHGRGKTTALTHFTYLAAQARGINPDAVDLPLDAPRYLQARDIARSPNYGPKAFEEWAPRLRWIAIDEIGREDERGLQRIQDAIDLCYREGIKTMMASQYRWGGPRELATVERNLRDASGDLRDTLEKQRAEMFIVRYGVRIWQRIAERGIIQVMKGPDWREVKANG